MQDTRFIIKIYQVMHVLRTLAIFWVASQLSHHRNQYTDGGTFPDQSLVLLISIIIKFMSLRLHSLVVTFLVVNYF